MLHLKTQAPSNQSVLTGMAQDQSLMTGMAQDQSLMTGMAQDYSRRQFPKNMDFTNAEAQYIGAIGADRLVGERSSHRSGPHVAQLTS
jgi:hypothetical protein